MGSAIKITLFILLLAAFCAFGGYSVLAGLLVFTGGKVIAGIMAAILFIVIFIILWVVIVGSTMMSH